MHHLNPLFKIGESHKKKSNKAYLMLNVKKNEKRIVRMYRVIKLEKRKDAVGGNVEVATLRGGGTTMRSSAQFCASSMNYQLSDDPIFID